MDTNNDGKIGLLSAVSILIGGMIGSAIFSLSGLTIFEAGPSAIITWILAAVIMGMYALVCAELAIRFPKSGGVFLFPRSVLGKNEYQSNFFGWISTWGYINANIVAIAFAAIYVGTYLSVGFPIFKDMQIPLALIAIVLVFILNSIKFTLAGKINSILVLLLAITMLIYIFTGTTAPAFDTALFVPFFCQGNGGEGAFLAQVPTAMVAYGSIVAISFMAGEVKNPNRNIPKSIFIAMLVVVCLYLGIIITTLGLIDSEFLKANPGMRFIPLYAAAFTKLMSITWLSKVISLSALFALLTTMLVVTSLTARAVKASADNEVLPKFFAKNNKFGVPFNASLVVVIPSLVISCFPGLTSTIVSFAALFASVTIVCNCVSLIKAKRTMSLEEGKFSVKGGIAVPIIAMILIILCYIPDVIKGGWKIWAYTLLWYLVGIVYFVIRMRNKKG